MRGPGVFYGYYENSEANAEAFQQGWFRTGDLGCMDERGFVSIVGRSKELYRTIYNISRWENLYSRKISVIQRYFWHPVAVAISLVRSCAFAAIWNGKVDQVINMDSAIYIFDLIGVAVFAISGALAAAEKRLDILGFILFGTITGIGGGTARDLLLGTDHVFWIANTNYLWTCIGASSLTWFMAGKLHSLRRVLLWADALGLALFSVLGTIKALEWQAPLIVGVVMGMMTASFGSLMRDVLLGRPPVLLEPNIYVTAALLGAGSYSVLQAFPATEIFAMPLAMAGAFTLRALAILFDLRLPKYGDSEVH